MDIDFMIQDTFALTRPQWKLVADLDEAGRAFAEAVTQNYKSQEPDKVVEPEEIEDDASSDGGDEDEIRVPEMEDAHSSSEEAEPEVSQLCFLLGYTNTISRRLLMVKSSPHPTSRRILLSPANRRSVIPKPKRILTESSRR